ncbi:hypothetical protein PoB_002935400 [Plakobranchus ocellatus]|uniref:Cleavage/polyadenylation specificity factor A subunit N-terminal domain-containing protein n=1 Tax=Plakobranchus ocellatus TaxID=259542 RepID=A0AAV4A9E8_9GAST|nr:hypothetical protein PoB_002935400 [Plakobranchus ocellatus]
MVISKKSSNPNCNLVSKVLNVSSAISKILQAHPHAAVVSSALGKVYALAVNRQLVVVIEQKVCCVGFGSNIDDFALLEGGETVVVAVAQRDGTVSLGSISDGQLAVTRSYRLCPAGDEGQTRIFMQTQPDSEGLQRARLFAMTTDSTLIMSSNILIQGNDIDVSKVKVQRASTPPGPVLDIAVTEDMVIAVGSDSTWVSYIVEDELIVEPILSTQEFGPIFKHSLAELFEQLAKLFLVLGDFNANSPAWGDFCRNGQGRML